MTGKNQISTITVFALVFSFLFLISADIGYSQTGCCEQEDGSACDDNITQQQCDSMDGEFSTDRICGFSDEIGFFCGFTDVESVDVSPDDTTDLQDLDNKCIRQCARQAKKEVRDCKNISLDCFNDNISDPLAILDYCSDSFSGSCEANVNRTYSQCLTNVCGMDLISYRSEEEFDALNGSSTTCSTNGADIIDPVLTEIQAEFNKLWETESCKPSVGLCPLEPVFDGKIPLGCSSDGADGAILSGQCFLIDPAYPVFAGFWVVTDIAKLNGLQYLQFDNIKVTEITGASGTQKCPYDKSADGGPFSCSYYGKGTVDANLQSGKELKLEDTDFRVSLRCETVDGSAKDHTLYEASFTCTDKNPAGVAQFDLCAGSCEDSLDGTMTYLQIPPKKSLSLQAGDLKCEFNPKTSPVSWFEELMIPLFEDQIADALEDPLALTIDTVLPPMPFPSSCSN
ncbi:MAG: hypothetical protein AAF462_05750 [Thermodesulfobacteriota bacterium]